MVVAHIEILVAAPAAGGVTGQRPAAGLVAGALEVLEINETFGHQHRGLIELGLS